MRGYEKSIELGSFGFWEGASSKMGLKDSGWVGADIAEGSKSCCGGGSAGPSNRDGSWLLYRRDVLRRSFWGIINGGVVFSDVTFSFLEVLGSGYLYCRRNMGQGQEMSLKEASRKSVYKIFLFF